MTLLEQYKKERSEGRAEGRAEGLAEGLTKGREEGILETLVSLVQKDLLSVQDAAVQAGITVEEFQKKAFS